MYAPAQCAGVFNYTLLYSAGTDTWLLPPGIIKISQFSNIKGGILCLTKKTMVVCMSQARNAFTILASDS